MSHLQSPLDQPSALSRGTPVLASPHDPSAGRTGDFAVLAERSMEGRLEIEDLLRRQHELVSVFQEIRDLRDDAVIGFEALLRLPTGGRSSPGDLFRLAATSGLAAELELAALTRHLEAAPSLPRSRLFLNLSAPVFLHRQLTPDSLLRLVRGAGLSPEQVVLELTELVGVTDPTTFASAIRPLRDQGFHLAIDDFGTGFSSLRLVLELAPEFLKLDGSLVTGAFTDRRRLVLLEYIALFGQRVNCAIVAEGLETAADIEAVTSCGILLGQGWACGRPMPAEAHRDRTPAATPRPANRLSAATHIRESVGPLSLLVEPVEGGTRVATLSQIFDGSPDLPAVPVVEGRRPIGLVTRSRLLGHLGHQYGFSLWRDRSVERFLHESADGHDALSAAASLEEAGDLVRRRPSSRRYDPIVIKTGAGDYHGLLTIDTLLAEVSRLKVDYALQSNPLTGLPGSVALAQVVKAELAAGHPFALGYADLDHFKPFNDRYGFARGDEALLLAAAAFRRHLDCREADYLAHPGGDDFAFVVAPADAEERALAATLAFSEHVRALYDPEDLAQGGIFSIDRKGVRRRFGLLSASIGLVFWGGEPGVDYHTLVEIATEVKCLAKARPGPSVVINRRSL